MEDIIIGTWWLVALEDGRRYLTKASKVIRRAGGSFTHSPDQMSGWVGLDDGLQGLLFTKEGTKKVKSEYFKGLNFPEITNETSPIEIEIGKSGRVYTYDP